MLYGRKLCIDPIPTRTICPSSNNIAVSPIVNVGGGQGELYVDGTTFPYELRTLLEGDGIGIVTDPVANNVEISNLHTFTNIDSGIVGQQAVFAGPNIDPNLFEFRQLTGENGIAINLVNGPGGEALEIDGLGTLSTYANVGTAPPVGNNVFVDGTGGLGDTADFRRLVAGASTGISVVTVGDDIIINNENTFVSSGNGEASILNDAAAPDYVFNELTGGDNITLDLADPSNIIINNDHTFANVGLGDAQLLDDAAAPDFLFRDLNGGDNITLVNEANNTITINNDHTFANTGTVAANSAQVLDPAADPNFIFREIIGDNGITVSLLGNDILLDTAGVLSTYANIGGGVEIFDVTSGGLGDTADFRTLVGVGSGISVVQNLDTIEIENLNTFASSGNGEASLIDLAGDPDFVFNELTGGDNITLDLADPSNIIINNDHTFANTGTVAANSAQVLDPAADPDFIFREIIGDNGIAISLLGNDILIDGAGAVSNFQNLGGGEEVYIDATNADFRTLLAGASNGISVATVADNIVINNENTFANAVGAANEVLLNPAGPNYEFIGIEAGVGIASANDGTNITIDNLHTFDNIAGADGELLSNPLGPDYEFRGITAGTGILINQNAANIQISNINTFDNVGTGLDVLSNPGGGPDYEFNTIAADSPLEVNLAANTITVSHAMIGLFLFTDALIEPFPGFSDPPAIGETSTGLITYQAPGVLSYDPLGLNTGGVITIPEEGFWNINVQIPIDSGGSDIDTTLIFGIDLFVNATNIISHDDRVLQINSSSRFTFATPFLNVGDEITVEYRMDAGDNPPTGAIQIGNGGQISIRRVA